MALSYVEYPGDGSTKQFAVTFPYLSRNDVHAFVDNVEVPFSWITDGLIELDQAPANGEKLRVRRITDRSNRAVDWTNGAILNEQTLDKSDLQFFYIAQEVADYSFAIPEVADRVGKWAGWDVNGEMVALDVSVDGTVPVSTYWSPVLSEITLQASLVALGVSEDLQNVLLAEDKATARAALGAGAVGDAVFLMQTYDALLAASIDAATPRTPTVTDKVPVLQGSAGGRVEIKDVLNLLPLRGFIAGLIMSPNADDVSIDVSPGTARDSSDTTFMRLTSPINKSLDGTWAAGDGQGGLDTGSKANNTWYHVFLIGEPGNDTPDILFSTSRTSPALPSGYTFKRRIGSVLTDGSGNIVKFLQVGNRFVWVTPRTEIDEQPLGDSNSHLVAVSVPPGEKVLALIRGMYRTTSTTQGSFLYVSDPDTQDMIPQEGGSMPPTDTIGDTAHTMNAGPGVSYASLIKEVTTNTSGQVRWRGSTVSGGTTYVTIVTDGYIDSRGIDD